MSPEGQFVVSPDNQVLQLAVIRFDDVVKRARFAGGSNV